MAKILSFGIDKTFLDTRAKLLAGQGLTVSSVSQKDEATRLFKMINPEIVIFGQKVPESLRSSLSRQFKKSRPDVQMIYMYLGSTDGTDMADAILNVESEPDVLISTIRYLEERKQPSATA